MMYVFVMSQLCGACVGDVRSALENSNDNGLSNPTDAGTIPFDPNQPTQSSETSAAAGAQTQLTILRAIPQDVLRRSTAGGRPNASGAVGQNQSSWKGAEYQRSAGGYFLYGLVEGDQTICEDAWRAFDYTFAHQNSDGSFGRLDSSGNPALPREVAGDIAFFLNQLDEALLVLRVSPLWSAFQTRAEALLPKIRLATGYMLRNKDVLVVRDSEAPNRYFIDALAHGLSGLLLRDQSLVNASAYYANLGLNLQDPAGYFKEQDGWDTGYNCTSILMLQIDAFYFPETRKDTALTEAVRWELDRIRADGSIDPASNTRTGLGQELYFGQAKDINYPEAVLALYHYGIKFDASVAIEKARLMFDTQMQVQ